MAVTEADAKLHEAQVAAERYRGALLEVRQLLIEGQESAAQAAIEGVLRDQSPVPVLTDLQKREAVLVAMVEALARLASGTAINPTDAAKLLGDVNQLLATPSLAIERLNALEDIARAALDLEGHLRTERASRLGLETALRAAFKKLS